MISKETIDQLKRGQKFCIPPGKNKAEENQVIKALRLMWPADAFEASGQFHYSGSPEGNVWVCKDDTAKLMPLRVTDILAYFQQGETSFSNIQTDF